MPANLPPQYYEEEKKLKSARTPEEKLVVLETLMRIIPKHKGTEKIRADLKRRMSKARAQDGKRTGGARKPDEHHVPREGAGQVALAGLPNSGKSTVVGALTKATTQVAEYPYATLKPVSGMARFEDVKLQLVDIPPVMWEVTDKWVANILRNADAICVLVALDDDPVGEAEIVLEDLKDKRIEPLGAAEEQSADGSSGVCQKRVFLAGSRADLPQSRQGLEDLREAFASQYSVVGVSAREKTGLESFMAAAYASLDKVRVYTKTQGKKADMANPFVLRRGTTVLEMAGEIHRDFRDRLRSARIFSNDGYNNQLVGKDFVLRDQDIIEMQV